MTGTVQVGILVVVLGFLTENTIVFAAEPADDTSPKQTTPEAAKPKIPKGHIALNPSGTVILDRKGKRLLLTTEVVLREGFLEMLCCRKFTKEHESLLSLDAKAYVVHTGLLALGAEPGEPVQYYPKYQPASGPRIDIFLHWTDKKGKPHRVPAQRWVRHAIIRYYAHDLKKLPEGLQIPEKSELRYDKKHQELTWYGPMTAPQRDELLALSDDKNYRKAIQSFFDKSQRRQMKSHWLFAGSGFYRNEETGAKEGYLAESGDVICVANFPTAMIDVAIESSASGEENLMFEADTPMIPPVGTKVTVELVPVIEKKAGGK